LLAIAVIQSVIGVEVTVDEYTEKQAEHFNAEPVLHAPSSSWTYQLMYINRLNKTTKNPTQFKDWSGVM
jgi:hypothetical protein